jgi:hypothetical protein
MQRSNETDSLLDGLTAADFSPPPPAMSAGKLDEFAFKQTKPPTGKEAAAKGKERAPKKLTPAQAEQLLSTFDLDQAFGPSVGLSRAERWERARVLGLSPPLEVPAALELASGQSVFARAMGIAA